ncbi:hypothetical protein FACS1894208_11890 [Clostridia bacterium]|nr:hypothetical protein FACS1894208_11890 [Clostridia bacterium]
MQDMILETNTLPNPLLELFRSPQVRVRETDDGVFLTPVELSGLAAIKKARGLYGDGKLTVDKFLAEKHAAGERW